MKEKVNLPDSSNVNTHVHTVWSKSFRTEFFVNRSHMRKTRVFFIQNKLHSHIHRLLRGRTGSEKLSKFPLLGPSLILQLRILGTQQNPQSGILLTSFSTWGTENNLAEMNLGSTGVINSCNIFGVKIGKRLQIFGRAHYRATRKHLEGRRQLEEPAECAAEDDPLRLYKILHLLFSPLV